MKERIEKLNEIWGQLPPSRKKLGLGVAILGILGLSAAILSWSGGQSSMRVLVSGADAKDLGEVVDVLKSNQVPLNIVSRGIRFLYLRKSVLRCVWNLQ